MYEPACTPDFDKKRQKNVKTMKININFIVLRSLKSY